MPKVLYNKYRSSTFDELIGQEHITRILKNAVLGNRISHAYLFTGSRGTGKTSSARILAKAINCEHVLKDGNPCNECKSCSEITQGKFLDLIEIDAASNRGIDQIRELKEKLEFSPSVGKFKVYIIDEVHMLTKEAFNALLKTLEEPPKHVVFILATTDVHKLPATILSRCQRYDFRLGTVEQVSKALTDVAGSEGFTVQPDALSLLVQTAKGSYRDGISLLDAVISGQTSSDNPKDINVDEVRRVLGIPDTSIVFDFLNSIFENNGKEALKIVDEIESRGVNTANFIKLCLQTLQDALVDKIMGTNSLDERYKFSNISDANRLTSVIGIFLNADKNLRNAPIPSLVLDMLIVQVASNTQSKETEIKVPNKVIEDKKNSKNSEIKEEEEEEEDITHIETDVVNMNLDLKSIEEKWGDLINALKPAKGRLFTFLANARPVEFGSNGLKLEVPFSFYKEQVENSNNREAISKAIKDVFGSAFRIYCEVSEGIKRKKSVSADIVLANINIPKQQEVKEGVKKMRVSKKVEAIFEGM